MPMLSFRRGLFRFMHLTGCTCTIQKTRKGISGGRPKSIDDIREKRRRMGGGLSGENKVANIKEIRKRHKKATILQAYKTYII